MERHLATLQRISELNPIEGADRIECAKVLGWRCVVKKGEFKVGDLIIYCEVDSLLPEKPEFEFLRETKFRIRTRKFKGQISQGLILPINFLVSKDDTFFEGWNKLIQLGNLQEGQDVTELLGIVKYEPKLPANLAGLVKGTFPKHIVPKTDETRVQVLQPMLDRYKGEKCYVSEKVDGSSCTIYYKDGEFGVCSRNLELFETPENSFWKVIKEKKIDEKLKKYCEDNKINLSLQGELVGNNIQKNTLNLSGLDILFFNIFNINEYRYYDYTDFIKISKELEISIVPILEEDFILINDIDYLVEKAKGNSKLNRNVMREGIVIRPLKEKVDLFMANDFGNGRVSFKVLNPEYLLKYGE